MIKHMVLKEKVNLWVNWVCASSTLMKNASIYSGKEAQTIRRYMVHRAW